MDEAKAVAPSRIPAPSHDGHKKTTAPALRRSLSLGALLTKAPNWSGPLVCDLLTSQDRLALFSTCRSANRTLLTTADHASIRLHVQKPADATTGKLLAAITSAIQTRGKLPTKLHLMAVHPRLLSSTLDWLTMCRTWLDELTLESHLESPSWVVLQEPSLPAAALTTIGRCWPNLRVLTIRTPAPHHLPGPDLFPKLEELTVQLPADHAAKLSITRTLALYMQQLTRLCITGWFWGCPFTCPCCSGGLPPPTLLPLLLDPENNMGTRLHTLQLPLMEVNASASSQQPFNLRLGDLITEANNWSCTLVTDCLDPQARLALFHTCKGSRRVVLETAERGTVRLRVTPQHLEPLKMGGLLATTSAMQVRGKLPCNQPLKLHLSTSTVPILVVSLGLMGQLGWLQDLDLDVQPDEAAAGGGPVPAVNLLPAAILDNLGCRCPNLHALNIRTPAQELPSPEVFSKLEELTVHLPPDQASREGLVRTLGPYVKQLARLTVDNRYCMPPALSPLLLTPAIIGTHLHTLHIPATLDDTLLGLLLQCTPALQELHTRSIKLMTGDHAQTTAPWRRLQCNEYNWYLANLTRLPLAPALEITCVCNSYITVTCDITTADAAAVTAAGRYKAVQFSTSTTRGPGPSSCQVCFDVQPSFAGVADKPDALRAGLSVLRSWGLASNITPIINLQDWIMTTELIQELQGLPPWKILKLGENVAWLPEPQSYAPLLGLLPDSYTKVCITTTDDADGAAAAVATPWLESICLGAPRDRDAAAAPLHIEVDGCAEGVVEAIRAKMEQEGPFPNVVVSE